MRKKFMRSAVAISTFLLFSSNAVAGSFSFSWGSDSSTESSQPTIKTKKNGPPSHAPAHGNRSKRQYQYFPSSSVYHDSDRSLYFYFNGSNWQVAASLPNDIKVQLGNSVSIELETDKPYIYNEQHQEQYPPGQMKKTKKEKGKKWAKK